ncbi:collagen-binding protein [Mucilaginibacter sp. PPCGB 2223]|nr:collagen-binding protein [Mucilaginibacter sp. PPCGB 2223]
MAKLLGVLLLFLLQTHFLFAQSQYTLSGTIKDAATGEVLIGATARIENTASKGAITNSFGFYSLTITQGEHILLVSYIGYKTDSLKISLHKDTRINIELVSGHALNEIVVSDKSSRSDNVLNPQIGVNKLNTNDIKDVPVFMGEKDIIRTIELLPGVKTTGDANTGFYVRGGGSDENLILLDGATVYNPSHLFGFFSTFNSDAVKDISLYKGGMPAQYGGRLSSVLDVRMDDGNNKDYGAEGGIGLISSRIKFEGPIIKNKGSFMLSARRTYADVFLKLSGDSTLKGSSLYFYDLNLKANYQLDDKNIIYLSGYFGKDAIGLKDNFATNWGNTTATLRWNHILNNKLFSNTSFIYSNYNYVINNFSATSNINVQSKIEDFNLKQDYEYFLNNNNTLSFGAGVVHHTIMPGNISTTQTSSYNSKTIQTRHAYEANAYISDSWQPLNSLTIVYGLRANFFNLVGPGTFNTYNADGVLTNVSTYSSGQSIQTYFNLEPRISANYVINPQSSVKASYNHNSQNIHLLSNSTSSLPTDLYVMSSNNIKPGVADQVSLGYYRNFKDDQFEFSTEVYYKWLKNEVDYRNDADLVANETVESQLLYGVGRAYGAEFFLKKKYGKFNGWIGYTLSRTERKIDGINNGNYFPARQDRTHDVSLVGVYNLSKRVTISAVFVYGTGNAVTYPAGKYQIGGLTTYYYNQRNANRLPADSRLDLGVTLEGKQHKRYHSSWNFSIYNAFDRMNPYSVVFQDSAGKPSHTEAVETSLFGIIPAVTWNFKFK